MGVGEAQRNGRFLFAVGRAVNEEQQARVGNQTGGRVFLFLYTDDIKRDFQSLLDHKIRIIRQPVTESWGRVAVFEDLYGNLWDLIEPSLAGGQQK